MKLYTPIISIIIPVYNLESFIEKCLNSLIDQSYENLELVIVDDGSTDNSVSIINEFVKKDSRIKLYTINHHGAASARKVGILHAAGPYVTFVDGDDFIEPNAIKVLMNEIIDNDCDIVIAKHRKIFKNNSATSLQNDYPFKVIDQLNFSQYINSKKDFTLWGKVFKLELFDDINFHEGIPIGEDALVLNQVILKAKRIKAINEVVYNYILHKDSISHKLYSKISSKLLYIKGSLDNVVIYGAEKQIEEVNRIFDDLLEYSKYYLKMTSDEKVILNSIWLTYFDKKPISKMLNGKNFVGLKYLISRKSPIVYSLFHLIKFYLNLSINKCKNRIKLSIENYKLLKS